MEEHRHVPKELERRRSKRFPIIQELTFNILNGEKSGESGRGWTVEMSTTGILFTTSTNLNPLTRIQLSVAWPALLNGKCPLKLVAEATVVRCEDGFVAVEIERCEFRTQGSKELNGRRALAAGS